MIFPQLEKVLEEPTPSHRLISVVSRSGGRFSTFIRHCPRNIVNLSPRFISLFFLLTGCASVLVRKSPHNISPLRFIFLVFTVCAPMAENLIVGDGRWCSMEVWEACGGYKRYRPQVRTPTNSRWCFFRNERRNTKLMAAIFAGAPDWLALSDVERVIDFFTGRRRTYPPSSAGPGSSADGFRVL